MARQVAAQPVAGSSRRDAQFSVPSGQGWQASFTFSSSRQRPVRGGNVINLDPTVICVPFQFSVDYQSCLSNPANFAATRGLVGAENSFNETTAGGPIYRSAPNTTLNAQMSFNVTPKWAASWGTSYDFRLNAFGTQSVVLQRELHDWRAIFSFVQAPNGNFAFNFFIALNAEPDLKFNFDRQTVRQASGVTGLP
jgi:hypothetical protein